ncbi:MAG: SDR family NAD(P)-dependent oxidoreductase [Nostoc sp.]
MKKFAGKVAIVTGSSRGIGKEIAIKLAHEGAKVVVNYSSSPKKAEEVVNQIQQQGGEAMAIQADMSQVDQIQQLVTTAVEQYGQLDILISNAGIEHFGKLEEITPQDFERVFSVNLRGQLFAAQAAARYLPSGGRIVLTSSDSARKSVFYHTLYAASKAAVSAMVLNLAPELGERGITSPLTPLLQVAQRRTWPKRMQSVTHTQRSRTYRPRLCSRARYHYSV